MAADHSSYEELARQRRGSEEYREGHAEARRAFLIGHAVRGRRLELGLSQVELAARAGRQRGLVPARLPPGARDRGQGWALGHRVAEPGPHGGRAASGWGRSHSRHGLMEMVQVKYVDVDRLPRFPKAWWFGYNREGAESANAFLEFLFDPSWTKRWTSAKGAMKALFRKHRI